MEFNNLFDNSTKQIHHGLNFLYIQFHFKYESTQKFVDLKFMYCEQKGLLC